MAETIDPAVEARKSADELRRKVYPDLYADEDGQDNGTQQQTEDKQQEDQQQVANEAIPDDAGRQQQEDNPDSETWKQRYQTLNGKYNAEIPRLQDQVSRLLEQLEAAQTKAQEATQQASTTQTKDLTTALEELREEYGDRMFDAIRAIARAESEEVAKPVREVAESTTKQVNQISFYSGLDQSAPGWRQLNEDTAFNAWLRTPDPVTGIDYHTVLMSHFERGDVAKTAAVFNYYAQSKSAAQKQKPDRTAELEQLVTPKKTGGGTASVVDAHNGDVLTMADYQKLHNDYVSGTFKGKEAEYQALKAKFKRAAQEGRLI